MKEPGPEHPITIAPNPRRVRVVFNGRVVADTTRALTLKESTYPAVQYIPREDADMSFFDATAHATHCPYKGDASYWNVTAVGEALKDVMWAYREPYDEMGTIRDHGAFYANKVRIEANPSSGAVGADL